MADIDWIAPIIFELRERGTEDDMPVDWQFQNVTFVLNVLDSLAGDDRYVDIRKRTRPHRILTKIDKATEDSRSATLKEQKTFIDDAKEQIEAAQKKLRDAVDAVEKRTDLDPRTKPSVVEMVREQQQRQLEVQIAALEKERNSKIKQSERALDQEVRGVQDFYKFLAVIVPPLPPLLLALAVFFHRRKGEQEGVDARRLRFAKPQQPELKK